MIEFNGERQSLLSITKFALSEYENGEITGSKLLLAEIYKIIKKKSENLSENLKSIEDYSVMGKAFTLMLQLKITNDIDDLQAIASIGYAIISKGIKLDESNNNFIKSRLLLLLVGDSLEYTVMLAFKLIKFSILYAGNADVQYKARDEIYKMQISDLYLHPIIFQSFDYFNQIKLKFDKMMLESYFGNNKLPSHIIDEGLENHEKLFQYLDKRIFEDSDFDF
jgi:hypothetical protein